MQLVARSFTKEQFADYAKGVQFNGWTPKFVVVHNTSAPDEKLYGQWQQRPGWTMEQWLRNLGSYYAGLGWKATPHLFVGPDKIGVLTPLNVHGTHTPSWNAFTWGVETVGEFEREPFSGGVRDNLIAALGILHMRVGLNPEDYKLGVRGLHFHKEDKATTHRTCPGKNMVKTQLVADVVAYMNGANPDGHAHISEAVSTAPTSGMSDQELTSVKWVQVMLNKWKPSLNLTVDGVSGNLTKGAIRQFQTSMHLKVDGIAGPVTRLALKQRTA